jgi:hypothetical protein
MPVVRPSSTKMRAVTPAPGTGEPIKRVPVGRPASDLAKTVPPPASSAAPEVIVPPDVTPPEVAALVRRDPSSFEIAPKALVDERAKRARSLEDDLDSPPPAPAPPPPEPPQPPPSAVIEDPPAAAAPAPNVAGAPSSGARAAEEPVVERRPSTLPPIPKGGSGGKFLGLVLGVVVVGAAIGAEKMGYVDQLRRSVQPTASTAASPDVPAANHAPRAETTSIDPSNASSKDRPSASGDVTPAPIPDGMGRLTTADLAGGRRIFVDGATVGQTPDPVILKCGSHTVRVGHAGHDQVIEVPCGAEIVIHEH